MAPAVNETLGQMLDDFFAYAAELQQGLEQRGALLRVVFCCVLCREVRTSAAQFRGCACMRACMRAHTRLVPAAFLHGARGGWYNVRVRVCARSLTGVDMSTVSAAPLWPTASSSTSSSSNSSSSTSGSGDGSGLFRWWQIRKRSSSGSSSVGDAAASCSPTGSGRVV